MVAFIPADPDAILRAIPGNPFRKWQQRRAFLTYGSPMVIASLAVDHPAEEIAQTATPSPGEWPRRAVPLLLAGAVLVSTGNLLILSRRCPCAARGH